MLIMPVSNGLLPHPDGGRITGMFLLEQAEKTLKKLSPKEDILLCPASQSSPPRLYPVGVAARISDIWQQRALSPDGRETVLLTASFEGRSHARWNTLKESGGFLISESVEYMDLKKMRPEYPVVSGAGWLATGGYTEIRGKSGIIVTIYGKSLENDRKVAIAANLGGLISPEQAHTIEHSVIRALNTYCLCSARTIVEAMRQETDELKKSVEVGLKYTLPEALGVTGTGFCGNPMTNLAQIYLARELIGGLNAGKSFNESLDRARKVTMSQLTGDINLTDKPALRALQGLKKGMAHDDTMLKMEIYKKVIARFPLDPWENGKERLP